MDGYVEVGAWPKELITIGYKSSLYSRRGDVTIEQCYYWEQRKKSKLSLEEYQPNLPALLTAAKSWFSCNHKGRRDEFKHLGSKHLLESVLPNRRTNCLWWLPKYLRATVVLRVRLLWLFPLKHSLLHGWEHPHRLTWLFICRLGGIALQCPCPCVIKGMA